jgi:hypothetical protein
MTITEKVISFESIPSLRRTITGKKPTFVGLIGGFNIRSLDEIETQLGADYIEIETVSPSGSITEGKGYFSIFPTLTV